MKDYLVTVTLKGPNGTKIKTSKVSFDYWNDPLRNERTILDTARILTADVIEDEFYNHRN